MSLSRSPSPRPNGGWSTPGLDYSNSSSPGRKPNAGLNGDLREDRWASAKARSEQLRNQPSYLTRNEGFFSRSKRKISKTLPFFDTQDAKKKDWRNAEKLGRGRWPSTFSSLRTLVGNVLRRFKVAIIILTIVLLVFFVSAKTGTNFAKIQRYPSDMNSQAYEVDIEERHLLAVEANMSS